MVAVRIRWLNGALRSLRAVHAWIEAENPQAARYVAGCIRATVDRLAEFPASGRRGRVEGTHELVVHNLPYIIVYRVAGEQVEILRVFHMAREWPPSIK